MPNMTDVAVIIINYNTDKYTMECVASVYSMTNASVDFQIVVFDNNSEPEDFDLLKNGLKSYKNLHLHRSPINNGFGGGNMLGYPRHKIMMKTVNTLYHLTMIKGLES